MANRLINESELLELSRKYKEICKEQKGAYFGIKLFNYFMQKSQWSLDEFLTYTRCRKSIYNKFKGYSEKDESEFPKRNSIINICISMPLSYEEAVIFCYSWDFNITLENFTAECINNLFFNICDKYKNIATREEKAQDYFKKTTAIYYAN